MITAYKVTITPVRHAGTVGFNLYADSPITALRHLTDVCNILHNPGRLDYVMVSELANTSSAAGVGQCLFEIVLYGKSGEVHSFYTVSEDATTVFWSLDDLMAALICRECAGITIRAVPDFLREQYAGALDQLEEPQL